ncbi:MAG: hypothetical protein ACJ8ED_12820 [Xanthobacteraceae bacterium]
MRGCAVVFANAKGALPFREGYAIARQHKLSCFAASGRAGNETRANIRVD